jgi:hypothetical protein
MRRAGGSHQRKAHRRSLLKYERRASQARPLSGDAAVTLLEAAKSGDTSKTAKAKAAFYANGNQVARFLHAANPRHWSLGAMETMLRIHLDQVVALAVDQLKGHYADAISLYNVYIGHILDMADMLSTGIMQQFPAQFR